MRRSAFECTVFSVPLAMVMVLSAFGIETTSALPSDVLALFQRLDALGTPSVKDAKYVVLDFKTIESLGRRDEWSVNAWLLTEDENTITVLEDDLRPKIYNKKEPTTIPSSWRPSIVKLIRVRDADFNAKLERLLVPEEQVPEGAHVTRPSSENETSKRCLAAYAAWQKNLLSYCAPIVQGDWYYQYEGAGKFPGLVWEDLAWRHFERGVNLLMFADRSEVLEHLELSLALSPTADFGEDRNALVKGLRRINMMKPVYGFASYIEPTGLDPFSRAKLYVWQLVDLRCVQTGQPGSVRPYASSFDSDSFLDFDLPTTQLLSLGFAAVPALIVGLFDDSPTRTVFHWRDFARNRKVWKVSDFSRAVLGHVFIKGILDVLAVLVLLSVIRPFYIRFAVSRELLSQTTASNQVESLSTSLDAAASANKTIGILLRKRTILVSIPLLISLVIVVSGAVRVVHSKKTLEAHLAAIRAKGEPADLEDLERWDWKVPDDQNAAFLLLKAHDAFRGPRNLDAPVPLLTSDARWPNSEEPLPAEVRAAIDKVLDDNRECISLIDQARDFKECRFLGVVDEPNVNDECEWLSRLGQLVSLQAITLADGGDLEGACAALARGIFLSESLRNEPYYNRQFTRAYILEDINRAAEMVLSAGQPTEIALKQLQDRLLESDDPDIMYRSLIGSRCDFVTSQAQSSVQFGLADALKEYTTLIDASRKPTRERIKLFNVNVKRLYFYVFPVQMPHDRHAANVALATVAIAIERYRFDKDKLPENLDELVPGYLDALPAGLGRPLKYERKQSGYEIRAIRYDLQMPGDGSIYPIYGEDEQDFEFVVSR